MRFSADELTAAVATATANQANLIAAARDEATKAERNRIAAVLASPAAKGREKQALAIAMAGSSVEAAAAVLAVTPPDAAPAFAGQRSKDAPGGLVVDAQGESFYGSETAMSWNKSIAKANGRVEAALAASVKP